MKWRDLKGGYQSTLREAARKRPHELLGVAEGAPQEDIKRAWLTLVKAYHPDGADPFIASHNQEMLKLINNAYEQLAESAK